MKFLMAIYGNDEKWASVGPDELPELIEATDAHNKALVDSGELIGALRGGRAGEHQEGPIAADGTRVVSDGPYIETKEYLGSFYVVDCDSLERALEIAAEMPSARLTEIEVRPLMHGGTADEL